MQEELSSCVSADNEIYGTEQNAQLLQQLQARNNNKRNMLQICFISHAKKL